MWIEQGRAQRWHDTDHGLDRGRPLRANQFRWPAPERDRQAVSACWCCCELCDPAWTDRCNPYWLRAVAEQEESDPAAMVSGRSDM